MGFAAQYLWHKGVGNGLMSVDNIARNGKWRGNNWSGSSNRISRNDAAYNAHSSLDTRKKKHVNFLVVIFEYL